MVHKTETSLARHSRYATQSWSDGSRVVDHDKLLVPTDTTGLTFAQVPLQLADSALY